MATTATAWTDWLRRLSPCPDAVSWAHDYPTFAEAWTACARGDWMLWLIAKAIGRKPGNTERRRLVACACQCARLALPYVSAGKTRPLRAIETAERWATGDPAVTRAQIRTAAAAADIYAADAAAYAYAAAYATADASDAAAAAAAARDQTLAHCADIVRAAFTATEIEEYIHAHRS